VSCIIKSCHQVGLLQNEASGRLGNTDGDVPLVNEAISLRVVRNAGHDSVGNVSLSVSDSLNCRIMLGLPFSGCWIVKQEFAVKLVRVCDSGSLESGVHPLPENSTGVGGDEGHEDY